MIPVLFCYCFRVYLLMYLQPTIHFKVASCVSVTSIVMFYLAYTHFMYYITLHYKLEGKYSLESTDPRESEIHAPPQPLPYLMPILAPCGLGGGVE